MGGTLHLTYKAFWLDHWVLDSVYGPSKIHVPYSYNLGAFKSSSLTVSDDLNSGWTFYAVNIPITLEGMDFPDGKVISGPATLTFDGSETGAPQSDQNPNPNKISQGVYIFTAPVNVTSNGNTPTENSLYVNAGSGSYTPNGLVGVDWFNHDRRDERGMGNGENRWKWCLDSSIFRVRLGTGAIRKRASRPQRMWVTEVFVLN